MLRWNIAALLLLPMSIATANEHPLHLQSSAERVAVVELFTSEGCSSCPPADRWLSSLRDSRGLWTRFVPLAFHVDYWDYLGWTDRFANARYGERQRHYAEEGHARTVYTPGVFVNGEEWRGWYRGRAIQAPGPRVGVLDAVVADGRVRLAFAPDALDGALHASVAILGMGLESAVAAGENAGRTLRHDFVVLDVASAAMLVSGEVYEADLALPPAGRVATRLAIVAWVSAANSPAPLQAVGGYL